MSVIQMKNMKFSYAKSKKRYVLNDLTISIGANETVGLIGANGAGKSTLLKLLVGLLEDYEGELAVAGLKLEKKNLERVREKIGYVFQDSESQLFLSTVYEDIAFGPRNYGYTKEEVDERVMRALSLVHIEDLKDRQIYRMSGGQKKLVSIATILALQPEVVLFDEPSIALDPKNRRNLIGVLNEMEGTKVIASHDLDMILDTCERTILLSGGSVVADGDTKKILSDKSLLEQHNLELPLSLQR